MTLSSTDMGGTVVLTNNNLTFEGKSSDAYSRSTIKKEIGKFYLEIKIDAMPNTYSRIGISYNDTHSASNSSFYYWDGNITQSGATSVAKKTAWGVGSTIGVAVNMETKNISYYLDGVLQHTVNVPTMAVAYLFVQTGYAGLKCTVNFGLTSFTYPILEGYRSYDGRQFGAINKILLLSNSKTYSLLPKETKHETKMTSNTAPAPFVVSASSVYNTTYPAWKAFNGTNSGETDSWISLNTVTGWLQINYGSQKRVNKVSITSRNVASTSVSSSPKDFNILGSNDGINFTMLGQFKNEVNWGINETRDFRFINNNYYQYYKIDILSNNGLPAVSIGELIFSYESIISQIPNSSVQNFIKYGVDSPIKNLEIIQLNNNYILQDTISENEEGLWTTQLNRKPLSIKFE